MLGFKILCACCGSYFVVCKDCYRGQVYCCDECRISGYREKNRIRQENYRKEHHEDIKVKHCEEERERRRRIKQGEVQNRKPSKIVKNCICLLMMIESLFKNFNPKTNKGKCAECECEIDKIIDSADMGEKRRSFDFKLSGEVTNEIRLSPANERKIGLEYDSNFLPIKQIKRNKIQRIWNYFLFSKEEYRKGSTSKEKYPPLIAGFQNG